MNCSPLTKMVTMADYQARNPPKPPPAGILAPRNVKRTIESDNPGAVSHPLSKSADMPGPSQKASGELIPEQEGRASSNREPAAPCTLAIMTCLEGVTKPDFDTIDEEALNDHLREVENYILSQTSFSDRRAYIACPETTRDEIYSHLEHEGAGIPDRSDEQRRYEMRLGIFNAADAMFRFFFPPDVEVPTTRKFWGALNVFITVSKTHVPIWQVCTTRV